MTPSVRFVFEPYREPNVGPTAYVYIETSEPPPCGPMLQNKVLLTRPATTWAEFREELNRLSDELDELRREAELRFANYFAKRYGSQAPVACRRTAT